jgi:nicotinamide-nucleotide amidase
MDAAALLDLARQTGAIIATAESCTGGMVAAALTDVPGSSDVFDRGFVTYSNAGALEHSLATLTVAITGIAGPGGSEHKPEGRVCFGLAARGCPPRTRTVEFGPRGRAVVREAARDHALEWLADHLSAID